MRRCNNCGMAHGPGLCAYVLHFTRVAIDALNKVEALEKRVRELERKRRVRR
ncbi:MAG TPA: hypothetical protein PK948_06650 [Gemmatimonadales bacterium]|nr:hypothetical protein [Gemmatimonadales bacterium]